MEGAWGSPISFTDYKYILPLPYTLPLHFSISTTYPNTYYYPYTSLYPIGMIEFIDTKNLSLFLPKKINLELKT